MRRLLPVLALSALACTNFLTPDSLQGDWYEPVTIPGSSLHFNLTQTGTQLAGQGAYAGEAGPFGTLQIEGSYAAPNVTLIIHYIPSQNSPGVPTTYTFRGTAAGNRMDGTQADSLGHSYGIEFKHQ